MIPELRLKPRTPPKSRPQSGELEPCSVPAGDELGSLPSLPETGTEPQTSSEYKPDPAATVESAKDEPQPQRVNVDSPPDRFRMEDEPEVLHQSALFRIGGPTSDPEEMTLTLTQSRISDLEGLSSSLLAREAGAVAASFNRSQVSLVYLSIFLLIYASIYLSIYLSINLSINELTTFLGPKFDEQPIQRGWGDPQHGAASLPHDGVSPLSHPASHDGVTPIPHPASLIPSPPLGREAGV